MTISSGDMRKNLTLLIDGEVYMVVEWAHRSAPKAPPTLTLKLKQLKNGSVLEKKFNATQKLTAAPTERKKVQYLYRDSDSYTFMDKSTFDQFSISADQLGEDAGYLVEGESIDVITYKGDAIAVELPPSVLLTVGQAEPGYKGDTSSGGTKPAVTDTGLKVKVPLFVNIGDKIRVDTRTGQYTGREE